MRLIRRSYEHLDGDSLVQLYKALAWLVRPLLEYGHVIRPLCIKTDLNKVENVQRRMTKLVPQIRDLEYPVYILLTGKYSTNEGLLKINRNSRLVGLQGGTT